MPEVAQGHQASGKQDNSLAGSETYCPMQKLPVQSAIWKGGRCNPRWILTLRVRPTRSTPDPHSGQFSGDRLGTSGCPWQLITLCA